MTQKIGFIGIGMMGHGMAKNLLEKGFPLTFKVNRNRDNLADLAQHEPGVFGARRMGGGFGGAVIALVKDSDAAAIGARVAAKYDANPEIAPTTMRTTIYIGHAGPGSGIIQS